jgi:tetratricopeptide (TPR) repeat protein
MKAGEAAMARLAFDESSSYFATALDLLGKMDDSEDVIGREITILLRMAETSTVLGEWRTALRYFYDTIRLCKADTKEKAMAHLGIGYIETKRTEWKTAKSSFKEALRISEAIDDKWGIADSLIGFARINWRLGDHDKTLEYTNRAIEAAKSIDYRRLIAQANMDIAGSFAIIKGDNKKAMEYLKVAQRTLDMERDLDLLIKVTNNMGDLYMKFGKYEDAMECFDKELEMAERSGVLIYKAFGNLSHGECLILMGKHANARPFIQKAQRYFEKMDDRTMISMTFTLEGVIARELGDFKEAEAQLEMALKVQEEKKLKWGLAKTLFEYGLLKKATEDKAQARDYLQRALVQYKELGSDPKIQEIEEEMKALDK